MKTTRAVSPVDLESETMLVSCIVQEPALVNKLDSLSSADITSVDLRIVYAAVVELLEDGNPTDPMSIEAKIISDGMLEFFGDEGGLRSLLVDLMSANVIPTYASVALKDIKAQRLRYELWKQGAQLYEAMADPTTDLAETVQDLKALSTKLCESYQYPTKIAEKLRSWVLASAGIFYTNDIYGELGVKDPQTKKAIVQALSRLCKEEVIEKAGHKRGCFRLVENQMDIMDYRGTTPPALDIKWPFRIEDYVKILPKSIVLVAGAPDAGKTALLMNLIVMNQHKHKIWYFNSEMGPTELQSRLNLFEGDLSDWTFTAVSRAQNFSDVIQPDDLNIIDYLEVADQMWMVGDELNRIHRKLRNGVAVVALQKDDTAVLGRGKSFSLEKPRLYLTIDKPGILRIVKAKNWRNPHPSGNPNDMAIEFKLVQGSRLIPQGEWYKDRPSWERQAKMLKKAK